jgi:hypothetical protein
MVRVHGSVDFCSRLTTEQRIIVMQGISPSIWAVHRFRTSRDRLTPCGSSDVICRAFVTGRRVLCPRQVRTYDARRFTTHRRGPVGSGR